MTAILLTITAAGRAALIDAALPGTAAAHIAAAGITATGFAANAGMTAMPGEFARITTVGGAIVDADTIHLIVRDDSAAAYAMRGFALYLADGTLFALYGQADPILEKSSGSTALLAVDVRFVDITDPDLTFNETGFLNPPATSSVAGVVELATDAETSTGTDAIRAVTPAGLKAAINARFGSNAASAFVRTLLDAATAAAFRLVLGIKSAALRDEGAGNGLDADLLDGLQPSTLPTGSAGGGWGAVAVIRSTGITDIGSGLDFHAAANDPADYGVRLALVGAGLTINGSTVWHLGNDGAGSGLDADLIDGQDGSYYTNIPARLGYTPWHPGNDGAGSGLDADLLDGRDAASFADAAHTHTAPALAPAFADQQLADSGWQRLPGGLLLQWGQYRARITGEHPIAIAFPTPFTAPPFFVGGNVYLPAFVANVDMWVQSSTRDVNGASIAVVASSSGNACDGFDWFAIGR